MRGFLILFLWLTIVTIKGFPDAKELKDLNKIKEEEIKILKTHQMNCIEEVRVDPDLVIKLKAGDWRNEQPTLKQWALCVLNKLGLMSLEGVYRLDEALMRIPKNDQIAAGMLIDECLSTKAVPPVDIAWKYIKCHHLKDVHGNFSAISIIEPHSK